MKDHHLFQYNSLVGLLHKTLLLCSWCCCNTDGDLQNRNQHSVYLCSFCLFPHLPPPSTFHPHNRGDAATGICIVVLGAPRKKECKEGVAYAANYRHLSVPGGVAQAWYVLSERRFLQADFDLCFIHQRFYALLDV